MSAAPAAPLPAAARNGALEVLLVEDNPGDVELTREALEEVGAHVRLSVARDGEAALAFLRREGPHALTPRPDLILLDLNVPKLDGRGVLAAVKQDPALCTIPVVVLTSSTAEQDVARAYELGANCYVHKPADLERFLAVVRSIEHFWSAVVRLPRAAP